MLVQARHTKITCNYENGELPVEFLPSAMNDRNKWLERTWAIRATSTLGRWWWWYWFSLITLFRNILSSFLAAVCRLTSFKWKEWANLYSNPLRPVLKLTSLPLESDETSWYCRFRPSFHIASKSAPKFVWETGKTVEAGFKGQKNY